MKKLLLLLFLVLPILVNAQQWKSEAEINRYYDNLIKEHRQGMKGGSTNFEKNLRKGIHSQLITHYENERKKTLADFRKNLSNTNKQTTVQNSQRTESDVNDVRSETELRREERGNMIRNQKYAELHEKNAGRRHRISRLNEEMEEMHENVNTANHQREMLGDGNWNRLQADRTEPSAVELNINSTLRRQINWFFCNLVEEYVFHYIRKPPFLFYFHDCLHIAYCKKYGFCSIKLN